MSYKIFKINKTSSHLLNIISSLKQIFHLPIISMVIVLVMTLALFLATIFFMLWNSKDTIQSRWNESAEISLYLKKNIDLKTANNLVEKLRQNPVIAKATLIQADEGMKAFAERTALDMLLSSFKENPLPNVIIIYPKIKVLSQDAALEFMRELKNQAEIATIKADMDWLERSHNWLNLWDSLSLIFIFALSINALLVIGGISYIAAQAFITKNNTPQSILLYQFAWYSLTSSCLALLLVKLLTIMLQNQNILIKGLHVSFVISIMFGSLLFSFICSMIAALKNI